MRLVPVGPAGATPSAAPSDSAPAPRKAAPPEGGGNPKVATPYAPPPSTVASTEISINVTLTACGQTCGKDWQGCTVTCSGGTACLGTCEDTYRVCLKAC